MNKKENKTMNIITELEIYLDFGIKCTPTVFHFTDEQLKRGVKLPIMLPPFFKDKDKDYYQDDTYDSYIKLSKIDEENK